MAGAGLVVDHTGGTSQETDVVIFDKFHVPAVLYKSNEGYFPIEGVYYDGEIKSRLTRTELLDAIQKFRSLRTLNPLPNAHGQRQWPARFIFAWSSDLAGNDIESELDRYINADEQALTDPAATIICVAGKGYCCVLRNADGTMSWSKIGGSDGIQEVVNFVGGVANSLIEFRMQKFGVKFGNYIIPTGQNTRLRNIVTPS